MTDQVKRAHIHQRLIDINAYLREDGLWDIEGKLTDVRDDDFMFLSGEVRPAGRPIHEMQLTWVLDSEFVILAAKAQMNAVPYAGICNQISEAYSALSGMRIGRGFNKTVNNLFGNIKGCTHVTHLIGAMATAAFQSMGRPPGTEPKITAFALDACHALTSTGNVVQFYRSRNLVKADTPEEKNPGQ